MFLFILEGLQDIFFNYIIQIHLMFLFILGKGGALRLPPLDSNTSHVLIYPLESKGMDSNILFKYISCSYLSK